MSNITDEAIQKAIAAVENIGPKAWALLVQEQKINASTDAIKNTMWITFLIALMGVVIWFKNQVVKQMKLSDEDDLWAANKVVLVIGCFLALIATAIASDLITDYSQYTHPEVFATKEILSRSK